MSAEFSLLDEEAAANKMWRSDEYDHVEPAQKASDVLYLVRSAIESQVARLELGLQLARKRLAPFEQKHGVTSEYFISEMAAEDLEGGDEEYVHWAGEYGLVQRLQEKLQELAETRHGG